MPAANLALYWFELDMSESRLTPLRAWLSPEERARADRIVNATQATRFAVARAGLRWLLSRRLNCSPAEVKLISGEHGKPLLSGLPLHFNLSHSGGYALVGIHPERELGVDIESDRPKSDPISIAKRFFTPAETSWLAALPPPLQPHAFCRLWTCKEAWMKAEGKGLALPLDHVEVTFNAGAVALRALEPPAQTWWVRELNLMPGYCAAVAQTVAPSAVTVEKIAI